MIKTIKKISLACLLGASSLMGYEVENLKPFEGINYYFGGSMSNADDMLVECRISLIGAVEYDFSEYVSGEVRYSYGLGEHYYSYEAFLKPKYKDVSFLIGYGKTGYMDHDIGFTGMRAGLQYNLVENLNVDFVYRFDEDDSSIGVSFKF